MSGISVTRALDGSIRIAHLTPWSTAVLLELDQLLGPDQPEAVRRRLFPPPSDDIEHQRGPVAGPRFRVAVGLRRFS